MDLPALLTRREGLRRELLDFAAHVHEVRAVMGNPFAYSRPEHPDEGVANFTGYSSQTVMLDTLLELRQVEADIRRLTEGSTLD
jgi:hypothetical protein